MNSNQPLLANINRDDKTLLLYNNKYTYTVDYTTFKHYLNYHRSITNEQITQFVLTPYKYIRNEKIFIDGNKMNMNINNISIKYNYNNDYTLDIDIHKDIGYIILDKYTLICDIDLILYMSNSKHNFIYNSSISKFPYYKYNNQIVTLVEHILQIKLQNIDILFNNNNTYDIRKQNLRYRHSYHNYIITKYPTAKYIDGHYKKSGRDSNILKNPMWYIGDNTYIMVCEHNETLYLDEEALVRIKKYEDKNGKITISKQNNYYVCNPSKLYVHQIIMDCYGNGKGTKNISVDHIDQNPANNRFSNLRIATQEIQQKNTTGIKEGTKRTRKKNATELPNGITQDMLPKYVVYCNRCYNTEKNLWREFFEINSHPNQNGQYIASSKSNKIPIHKKLEEIKQKLYELNQNTYTKNEKIYPTGIYIKNMRGSDHFILDLRKDNIRYNLKMKMNNTKNITDEYNRFILKISKKYPDFSIDN